LLVSSQLQPEPSTPKGGNFLLGKAIEATSSPEKSFVVNSSLEAPSASVDEYARLQRRILLAVLIVSALAVLISSLLLGFHFSSSFLVGAFSGLLYLWLLSRSVGMFGKNGSKNVSKVQLLVPVVLFLVVLRVHQLDFLPAVLGFLLYKPVMVCQVLIES